MSDPIVSVDWTATHAADWLDHRVFELRAEALRCAVAGFGYWAYEFEGLAAIAERAAKAERIDPPDPMKPCGICKGRLACDIIYHRSLT